MNKGETMNEIDVGADAMDLFSEMVTLLLSWQIARYMGRNQAGAIRKTARKLRNNTKCKQSHDRFKAIANAKSDTQVVDICKRCYHDCKDWGIL